MIQLSRSQCPSPEAEREEYGLHQNDPFDPGYRRFLGRLTGPVLQWLDARDRDLRLLDFGSGPSPAISVILGEHGWEVDNFDPFFQPALALLEHRYDLVTCTEVVEHFFEPAEAWARLISMIGDDGQLVVMTQPSDRRQSPQTFADWHYIRENSHVAFYHSETMHWIARQNSLDLRVVEDSVFWFSHRG